MGSTWIIMMTKICWKQWNRLSSATSKSKFLLDLKPINVFASVVIKIWNSFQKLMKSTSFLSRSFPCHIQDSSCSIDENKSNNSSISIYRHWPDLFNSSFFILIFEYPEIVSLFLLLLISEYESLLRVQLIFLNLKSPEKNCWSNACCCSSHFI